MSSIYSFIMSFFVVPILLHGFAFAETAKISAAPILKTSAQHRLGQEPGVVYYACNLTRGGFYQEVRGSFNLAPQIPENPTSLSGNDRVDFSNGFHTLIGLSIVNLGQGQFLLGAINLGTVEAEGLRVVHSATFSSGYVSSPAYSIGADFVLSGGGWDDNTHVSSGCVLTVQAGNGSGESSSMSSDFSSSFSSMAAVPCMIEPCLSDPCGLPTCVNFGCCASPSSASSSSQGPS